MLTIGSQKLEQVRPTHHWLYLFWAACLQASVSSEKNNIHNIGPTAILGFLLHVDKLEQEIILSGFFYQH